MTIVQFRRSAPQADGSTAPATGYFRFTPSKQRTIVGTPDNIVAPVPFTADLVSGLVTVDLAPNAPGSAWLILESVDGARDLRYHVVVPALGPVDDPDLIRVDPQTLDPQAEPEAAWWAAAAVPPGVAWVYLDTDGTPYFEGI